MGAFGGRSWKATQLCGNVSWLPSLRRALKPEGKQHIGDAAAVKDLKLRPDGRRRVAGGGKTLGACGNTQR
eukprot:12169999-Alexandrium_andersonii.AAC.1